MESNSSSSSISHSQEEDASDSIPLSAEKKLFMTRVLTQVNYGKEEEVSSVRYRIRALEEVTTESNERDVLFIDCHTALSRPWPCA